MPQAFIEHLVCAGTRVITESPELNQMWSWPSGNSKPSEGSTEKYTEGLPLLPSGVVPEADHTAWSRASENFPVHSNLPEFLLRRPLTQGV